MTFCRFQYGRLFFTVLLAASLSVYAATIHKNGKYYLQIGAHTLPSNAKAALHSAEVKQNNTSTTRQNNAVKYLPPNVTQVTVDSTYPDLCAPTFTLSPHGSNGDSCTLELTVSNGVNGYDTDPHHHLFVCFPGGVVCAGTSETLNVSIIPQRFSYVASLLLNTVTLCSIDPITGLFINCQDSGVGAAFNFPTGMAINEPGTYIYVSDFAAPGGAGLQARCSHCVKLIPSAVD